MRAAGRFRAAGFAAVMAGLLITAAPARAQEDNPTTPGAIPNPGTYQGSLALQHQEQQQYQQQEQQNQQMQQRLDQNYRQYAPGRSGGRGGPAPVNWFAKPPLPPAKNPLLGRWRQVASRGLSAQQAGGSLGGLLGPEGAAGVASFVNSAMAGGCKSMFGSGVIAFTPTALNWVAPDGHEEILNHVEYRANGADVVVLTRDPGAVPALFFGLPNHDHAVVAVFQCTMERLGARPVNAPQTASVARSPTPAPGPAPAASAGAGRPADALLKFDVGAATPGNFTPFAGLQIWVTPEDPQVALGAAPAARLAADCGDVQACAQDLKLMTAKALGSVRTDAQGHAQTPHLAAGRYYLVGIFPYQGHAWVWDVPINLQPGDNGVTLDQTNGRAFR